MGIEGLIKKADKKFTSITKDLKDRGFFLNERDQLLYCELYKLISRGEIIKELGDSFMEVNSVPNESEFDLTDEELMRIKNSGFLIKDVDINQIILITDYYSNYDLNITAYFPGYNIITKYVTPLNFELLQNGESYVFSLFASDLWFKRILYDALEKHASDIHLINRYSIDTDTELSDEHEFCVYYRILNSYEEQHLLPLNRSFNNSMIREIISKKTLGLEEDLESTNGVKTSWLNPLGDNIVDLRITASCTSGRYKGYTLVARISKMNQIAKDIESLGFPSRTQEFLKGLSNHTNGLTLVTGAIRTGKNTTMVAVINHMIKQYNLKFLELSSPLENRMPFEQIDYKDSREIMMDYIELVKKQDVDVVIINELPSKKVADSVLDIINSSVGVFTTFHINRIWHLPYKLKDYFGSSYKDLITQITGVCNQKMFVELCPYCKTQVSKHIDNFKVNEYMKEYEITSFYEAKGCPKCNYTGKRGIQPYAEYLDFTQSVKSKLLSANTTYEMENIIKDLVESNRLSLEYQLLDAIKIGKLSPMDVLKL